MPQNCTHTSLKHISNTFLVNIGKHVFSPHEQLTQQIKKAKEEKKTQQEKRLISTLDPINQVREEKKANNVYVNYKKCISFEKHQFTCNECKKADCEKCCEKFFGYTLLHAKNSEYNRRNYLVFILLKKHIEKLRNKTLNTSALGFFDVPSTKKVQKTSGLGVSKVTSTKQVYLLDFLEAVKLQAKKKYEMNYPSLLTNIAFIEILLTPIGLTENKEITDPNLREIGNYFIGPDENKHTEKNIKNLFKMFDLEIRKLLVILESSYTTQRSRALTKNEWALWFQKKLKNINLNDIKEIKKILNGNTPVLQQLSAKFRSSNPNKVLSSKFNSFQTGKKPTLYADSIFSTTADLQQIFGDTVLSGIILFKCVNLNNTSKSASKINFSPTNIEKDFIESYCYNDNSIKQLSSVIPPLQLQYDNFVHLFSFSGFGIYHSYLSLNGALNKFKSHFNRKNQLDFLELENLCNHYHGFNFIKFALYKCEPFMKNEEREKIIIITHDNQNLLRFVFYFDSEIVDEKDLELEISKKTIEEMENLSARLQLTDENFGLILLRLKELLLFLNIKDLFFSRLQRKHFKKYKTEIEKQTKKPISGDEATQLWSKFSQSSEIDEFQLRKLTKEVLSIIFNEICRFLIFEAALISQTESMKIYNAKKCKDEVIFKQEQKQKKSNFPKHFHTITFQNKNDLSGHEFFKESEFYFPKNTYDRNCNRLQTTITHNIQSLEPRPKKLCKKYNFLILFNHF